MTGYIKKLITAGLILSLSGLGAAEIQAQPGPGGIDHQQDQTWMQHQKGQHQNNQGHHAGRNPQVNHPAGARAGAGYQHRIWTGPGPVIPAGSHWNGGHDNQWRIHHDQQWRNHAASWQDYDRQWNEHAGDYEWRREHAREWPDWYRWHHDNGDSGFDEFLAGTLLGVLIGSM